MQNADSEEYNKTSKKAERGSEASSYRSGEGRTQKQDQAANVLSTKASGSGEHRSGSSRAQKKKHRTWKRFSDELRMQKRFSGEHTLP